MVATRILMLFALVVAVAAGTAVWMMDGGSYTASAQLRIAPTIEPLIGEATYVPDEFKLFRGAQEEYVTNRWILSSALRTPGMSRLPMIEECPDPEQWLMDRLRVEIDGEVMNVSLTTNDPDASKRLVNAVVDAYLNEVINQEQDSRREHLKQVEEAYEELASLITRKRGILEELCITIGVNTDSTPSMRQQLVMEDAVAARKESLSVRLQRLRIENKITAQREIMTLADNDEELRPLVSPWELENAIQSDPIIVELVAQAQAARDALSVLSETEKSERESAQHSKVQAIDTALDDRREEISRALQLSARHHLSNEITELTAEARVLREMEKELEKHVHDLSESLDDAGRMSVEIVAKQREIDVLDEFFDELSRQLFRLRLELDRPSRIELVARAEAPRVAGTQYRWAKSIGAGLVVFVAIPLGLILLRFLLELVATVFVLALPDRWRPPVPPAESGT